MESEEKALLDTTNDLLKSPDSSKSTTPETPVPKKISLKRNVVIETPILEQPKKTDNSENESEPDKKIIKISELSAKDRMEMRAKKFGANSPTGSALPSQSKLDARAARFGISSSSTSSPSTNTSNVAPEILKKRAERFGETTSVTAKKSEYEEKLLKRKERFGAEGKVVISSSTSDTDYKEKAKLRLERFKQTA